MPPPDGSYQPPQPDVKFKPSSANAEAPRRAQYAVVLVLTPNNDTFERKNLVVPFYPDILKLGRQTNTRTAASPDNGFFDSRVLSRQHAEVWADRETGKVWIKDCKSSNGTYINKQRLSGENKESDAFELQQGDVVDLGIDISDEDALVYQKISATVARISTVPLHVKPINTAVAAASGSQSGPSSGTVKQRPQLSSVKPGFDPSMRRNSIENSLHSIYGVPITSLDLLALNHSRSTVNSLPSKAEVLRNVEFDLAARRLAAEIKEAKLNLAKLSSVKGMLEDIKRYQAQAPSIASTALRAENERLRVELNVLSNHLTEVKLRDSAPPPPSAGRQNWEKVVKASDINNMVLLMSSSALMVITGIGIMALFNPPA